MALSPTIAFRTLGCKVNRAESDEISDAVVGRGATLVSEDEAGVVVVNTCTVTAEADRKSRKAIRRALRMPEEPVVVVTGCLAVRDASGLAAVGKRVVVEADKKRLPDLLSALVGVDAVERRVPSAVRAGEGFRTRAVVKVEDGCDCSCAYCIVPLVRGLPRATPLADVVSQVEELVEAGVAEVVLTGINLGRYSSEGADLSGLLRSVAATGVRRLRISSVEPLDLTERLVETLTAIPSLCPHLHVPLQSGSDSVLAAMGRCYTVAEYSERLEAVREAVPDVAVTTDVMAGFPGETESDAVATAEAVERLGFTRLHVFRYSRRPGTRAAGMSGEIEPRVMSKRAARLRDTDARLREAHMLSRVGRTAEVLVEKVWAREGVMLAEGTTEDYLTLRLAGTGYAPGDVVEAKIASNRGEYVLGEVVFPGASGLA